ncbi:MAG: hypothetical protein RL607_641 [Bacteroidota bacterium]|jgi:cell division septum initiation protein DivIVA
MGLFGHNQQRQLISLLQQKSEAIHQDISQEIDELLDELKSEYEENQKVDHELEQLLSELATKLDPHELSRLQQLSLHLKQVKRCARKGVDAMKQLARDHKKAVQENRREYDEFLYP